MTNFYALLAGGFKTEYAESLTRHQPLIPTDTCTIKKLREVYLSEPYHKVSRPHHFL